MSSLEALATDIKYIRESVDELNNKVAITNGRVKTLELLKAYMMGGLAVITTILIPIAFKVLFP